MPVVLYIYSSMDVAIAELRAHLSDWLGRARHGEDIVVTDRGVPVARIVGLQSADVIEVLKARGVISGPRRPSRPSATSYSRPRARRPVADRVTEQRR